MWVWYTERDIPAAADVMSVGEMGGEGRQKGWGREGGGGWEREGEGGGRLVERDAYEVRRESKGDEEDGAPDNAEPSFS